MAGSASRQSPIPTAGPSDHGPTSRPSSPVRPLIPSAASAIVSTTGAAASASASSESGSFPSSIASTRHSARERNSSPQAAARRRRRNRRQVRLEQAVGLAPLALREPPGEPSRPGQQRQADPQRREQHAEHQPAADHEQVRQSLPEPDDHVQQRPPRGAQVRGDVERGGHDAASTVTSPLVLSAWIWNGASSTGVTPRMRVEPESLWASIW